MPSPLVHATLPAACLVAERKTRRPLDRAHTIRLCLAALIIANLPDIDLIPALWFRAHFEEIHRAWGHNIFSVGLWTFLGSRLLAWADGRSSSRAYYWCAAAGLALSHIFLDAAGHFNEFGFSPTVPVLWPLSNWELTLPFRLFATMDFSFPPVTALTLAERVFSWGFWRDIAICEVVPAFFVYLIWRVVLRSARVAHQFTQKQKGDSPSLESRPSPLTR
jgi:membrane-bound metal-dependent hydrolase YbcI (DUF457 family)